MLLQECRPLRSLCKDLCSQKPSMGTLHSRRNSKMMKVVAVTEHLLCRGRLKDMKLASGDLYLQTS